MTSKEFASWVYSAAKKASDIDPVFVTAQAALESGWGRSVIGKYNLFGITKGSGWTGKTILVTTHEVFNTDKKTFAKPEEIISITKLQNGKYQYKVKRLFKDFDTLEQCLNEHLRILQKPFFADAWPYRKDGKEFSKRISDNVNLKYATDPNYYKTMCAMIDTIKRLLA